MRNPLVVLVCISLAVTAATAQPVWSAANAYLAAPAAKLEPASAPVGDAFVRAHRAVSTMSARAQAAFDDGLTLLYAFNPEQARRSFETAAKEDPALAMAWWGIAMSYGMNINTPFDSAQAHSGHAAIAKARALESEASPAERALIGAATQRFGYDGSRMRTARRQHTATP